eukprot:GHVS01007133.1.p1 GENE.GHVS01007133.1~~GHVS01007133.1.p1  ORF type:complete len:309 (-),score=23.63 GHVS01007133.1:210-1136(-)
MISVFRAVGNVLPPAPSPLLLPFSLISRRHKGTPGLGKYSPVKAFKYSGSHSVKVHAPKTEWYVQAETDFLAERDRIPDGFISRLQEMDVSLLRPQIQRCLHLRCASRKAVSNWRKWQLQRKLQRRPFDTGSPAVQIGCLTEKILHLRAHLIRNPRDHPMKKMMSIFLNRRARNMKRLYRTDFDLYQKVCKDLRIACVMFSIPDSRDRAKQISTIGMDGDRCKFLIRQRIWKHVYRPRAVHLSESRAISYTRHPIEKPPEDFNVPRRTAPQASRAWPYGVKEERTFGDYRINNPTAPGTGHCPVPMLY